MELIALAHHLPANSIVLEPFMPHQSQSTAEPSNLGEDRSIKNADDSNIAVSSRMKRWAPILVIIAILTGGYLAGLNQYFSLEFITENRDKLMVRVEENFFLS